MGVPLPPKLPVHGFVLSGGKSSRMGEDKALLRFGGRPMVEIAVEKLRGFCAEVSIVGNREDLAGFAPVVGETRVNVGPAAGVEAGLKAASEEWVMFMPVDVPMVPGELLRGWCEMLLPMEGIIASDLYYEGEQPAFCMLRRECLARFSEALDGGERRLRVLLRRASDGSEWQFSIDMLYEEDCPNRTTIDWWFKNVNTPQDLAEAEAWARAGGVGGR